MIRDELLQRLKLCYSGDKKAYDELVLFILNYKPPYTSEYAEKLEAIIKEAVDFIKEHITETEYRYVYSKTINVIETLELNNEELIKLLEILERTDV